MINLHKPKPLTPPTLMVLTSIIWWQVQNYPNQISCSCKELGISGPGRGRGVAGPGAMRGMSGPGRGFSGPGRGGIPPAMMVFISWLEHIHKNIGKTTTYGYAHTWWSPNHSYWPSMRYMQTNDHWSCSQRPRYFFPPIFLPPKVTHTKKIFSTFDKFTFYFSRQNSYIIPGSTYHPEHFVCANCNLPFPNGAFIEHEGKPYCEFDFNQLFCPRCANCQQPIVDKCVNANGKQFHPHHFNCTGIPLTFIDLKFDFCWLWKIFFLQIFVWLLLTLKFYPLFFLPLWKNKLSLFFCFPAKINAIFRMW